VKKSLAITGTFQSPMRYLGRIGNREYPLQLILLTTLLTSFTAWAGEPVTISVDSRAAIAPVSKQALGLSFETSQLLPDKSGVHYFRPDNKDLVALFRTLGIESLRIGGNSVDAASIPIPSEADIDSLFEFAKVAGVKVIYSVRLENGDPRSAAQAARRIHEKYRELLSCFAIGNEPSYYKAYPIYREKWLAIRNATAEAFPGATFCGPDQNPSPELDKSMARDFGNGGVGLMEITQHSYPFGCSYKNPSVTDPAQLIPIDAAAARERMLSPAAYQIYDSIRRGIADSVSGTSLAFRLTETNSFWYSGLAGASDRYVAALWSVDYLHWWILHGADGVNFHTGDKTGGSVSLPSQYAAFVTAHDGYDVRPLAYGLMLFHLGASGSELNAHVSSTPEKGLVAYATLAEDSTISITVINKAHGDQAKNSEVRIVLYAPLATSKARALFLSARNGDITAKAAEVSMGRASIRPDGSWSGHWVPIKTDHSRRILMITMPPASAVLINAVLQQDSAGNWHR
jgi:hypothetical protein